MRKKVDPQLKAELTALCARYGYESGIFYGERAEQYEEDNGLIRQQIDIVRHNVNVATVDNAIHFISTTLTPNV